ncbi:MAG: hydrogenase expression/formation protein HypE [Labilithrix sp.]|nr:hydrogenase expression/formation protein HypE [Labilithrix sp.]MCW5815657.1 hydrogenase expression/formation protein HypE [Labilithrix sp.]
MLDPKLGDALLAATCPVPIADTPTVLLGHGSGGRLTAKLIEETMLPAFRNPLLEPLEDAAILAPAAGRIALTTDSYVVTPIFFPGGDIGELAVNGTVNDLVVSGARPLALSLAFILEEGFPLADLERVVASVKRAAERARVRIATGDTKVVGRGSADKVFINTSGVGVVPEGREVSARRVREGDAILVSGTIGDHGVAILSCREGLAFGGDLASDTAPLGDLVESLLAACPTVHAMRDPTRGGVAATVVEIASREKVGIELDEELLPVRDVVRGACEMLGLDPLLVANEGKLVAFVPEKDAAIALAAMRAHPLGRGAARIGRVTREHPGVVWTRTPIGGARILELPYAEMLPRIC